MICAYINILHPSPNIRHLLFITWLVLFSTHLWAQMPAPEAWLAIPEGLRPAMVVVEGGSFVMGTRQGEVDERPEHKVDIRSFALSKHEITVEQFEYYCQQTGLAMPAQPTWSSPTHPVVRVTWAEAAGYCQWIGGRLPTEAEWEYAAQGGTHQHPSLYAGSATPDSVAWYSRNSRRNPQPVGLKQPNALGLFDMSGNVWEWCADYYHAKFYARSPEENPLNDQTATQCVIRGGGWKHDLPQLRLHNRGALTPQSRESDVGFRVCWPFRVAD
ncbi:formylglycine-generating enzyme family protein [Eisenibacter elegans]|uniref:formylglycine-generating enzyme family protein n=1 Tax=Eisenibacter elegans TaxID=997 RepID=UPI00068741AD|nr:SUMF1/EgtB/PvdO family nonheme iron enzyme [Eisenibacter elegans]